MIKKTVLLSLFTFTCSPISTFATPQDEKLCPNIEDIVAVPGTAGEDDERGNIKSRIYCAFSTASANSVTLCTWKGFDADNTKLSKIKKFTGSYRNSKNQLMCEYKLENMRDIRMTKEPAQSCTRSS